MNPKSLTVAWLWCAAFAGTAAAQVCESPSSSAACCSPPAASAGTNAAGAPACGPAACSTPCAAPAAGTAATCAAPTGSASCGTPDLIATDPAASAAPRGGPSPADRGLTDLAPLLEPIREVFRVPGLGAALVREGRLDALGVTGIRRVGSDAAIEVDDPFHLGSCGKALTATVAAVMVEHGQTKWTATIGEAFPEYASTMHAPFRDVTLRDLLAHRGGFPSRSSTFDQAIAAFQGTMPAQRSALVRYAVANVPAYSPGSQFNYSDVGYSVGGAMIGRAAGEPWEDLVRELLAEPLQLTSLGFGAPGAGRPESVPRGHVLRDGELVALGVGPGEDLANPAIGPAGTIHLSLSDWATFAAFHLRGARRESTELLSADGFRALHEDPYGQGYALGWFVTTTDRWDAGRALTHTGSCGAWSALIWILPERNAAILATSNYGGGSGFQALQLAVDRIGEKYLAP